jgi:methanogenic corrinoid protein MtbC1
LPDSVDMQPGSDRPQLLLARGAGPLLRCLARGPHSVSQLVEETGLRQPNVSNHLARLRDRGLVTSRREGRQVFYQLATAGLAHFVAGQGAAAAAAQDFTRLAEEFLRAVLTLREEEAARVVDAALSEGAPWRDLYLRVFAPTLQRVGERWEAGELSVATEHLITGIILRLLHRLSLNLPAAPEASAPSALVACVEGEMHTLGGRMVADFLLAQGWRVWYLNGYLPQEHLLEAVRRHLPDSIVLCVSTDEQEQNLRATVERLVRWRGEQPLPLLVAGGRYFAAPREIAGVDVQGTDIEAVTEAMAEKVAAIRAAWTQA